MPKGFAVHFAHIVVRLPLVSFLNATTKFAISSQVLRITSGLAKAGRKPISLTARPVANLHL